MKITLAQYLGWSFEVNFAPPQEPISSSPETESVYPFLELETCFVGFRSTNSEL